MEQEQEQEEVAVNDSMEEQQVEQEQEQEEVAINDSMEEQQEEGQEQQQYPATVEPPNVEADLDEEAQVDDDNSGPGVMKVFLRAVHAELKEETKDDFTGEKWLLGIFKANNWWLRVERLEADNVLERLNLEPSLIEYYRDIYLWLPDLRWEAMPACPCCKSASRVRFHCWRDNHFGRRIVGLDTHYFVISRRYYCRGCHLDAIAAKEAAVAAAQSAGLTVEGGAGAADGPEQYTFTAWDERSRPLLPHGLGSYFPAFLTHRGGVDMAIIDLQRPLFDKGFKPGSLSSTLLELHTKRHTHAHLQHENKMRMMKGTFTPMKLEQFSTFGDKKKYDGSVPTGKYLTHVYQEYAVSIKEHLHKAVKMRGCGRLHWDVSYKSAKHLAKYHGQSLFKGLVTGTNEIGEIRVQFHIVTDGQDQFVLALKNLLDTLNAYGHAHPNLFTTDVPATDDAFFKEQLPSLVAAQEVLDGGGGSAGLSKDGLAGSDLLPAEKYSFKSTAGEMNMAIDAFRDLCKGLDGSMQGVMAIDAEWDTVKSPDGRVVGSKPISLIQFAIQLDDGTEQAMIFRVHNRYHKKHDRHCQRSISFSLQILDLEQGFPSGPCVVSLRGPGPDIHWPLCSW